MSELTTEQKAEQLARRAADRAAELAMTGAEKAQELAVTRALRDASVDRDLRDHDRHLQQINGSQLAMAKSLAKVEVSVTSLVDGEKAQAKFRAEMIRLRLSRRAQIIATAGLLAAWLSVVLAVILR